MSIPFRFGIILPALLLLFSCASTADPIPANVSEFFSSVDGELSRFRCSDVSNLTDFQSHTRYYLADSEADEVWQDYVNVNLSEGWKGPIGHFGALYDPYSDVLYTRGSRPFPRIEKGQIVFLDLIIEAMLHITAAFQISRIDEERRVIEFTYLEQNTSQGRQEIRLFPVDENGNEITLIRHRTWYRSGSRIRDRFFYAPYHTQAIDEYHSRIAEMNKIHLTAVSERRIKKKGLIPTDPPL